MHMQTWDALRKLDWGDFICMSAVCAFGFQNVMG
jgi:hypothetical protein